MIKNYIYNSLFQILRIILPIITMPYIARILSADGVGAYSLSSAWANYFMIIGMIGVEAYGCREIAYARADHEKCRRIFWEINTIKSISVLLSIVIYSVIIFGFIRPANILLYYLQLLNLLSSFFDVSWYFSGIENFKSTSIRNIVVKLISTVGIFVFVKRQGDVWIYTLILCLGQLMGQLVLWKDIIRELFPVYIPNSLVLVSHLKKTVLLWVPSLAASIYNYLDKVMLGEFTNDFQVGIYDYSQNIVKIPATLIFAIATVTMPHAASDFTNKNNEAALNVFYKSMRIVTLLAFPMCFGFMAIGDNFVSWFLGNGYMQVGKLLKVSTWVILPISWSQIVGSQLIIAKSREKYYSLSICGGAIVNILLNLLFIKKYQAEGVLVASIIAEIVVLVIMLFFSKEDYHFFEAFRSIPKYMILSSFMYCFIHTLSSVLPVNSILLTIIQILSGMILYFVMLMLTRDQIIIYFTDIIKNYVWKH